MVLSVWLLHLTRSWLKDLIADDGTEHGSDSAGAVASGRAVALRRAEGGPRRPRSNAVTLLVILGGQVIANPAVLQRV